MSEILKKSSHSRKPVKRIYVQVLMVFLMSFLVVLSTSFFMSRTLNNRLQQNVDDTVNWVQTSVSSALQTPEIPFGYISENIQSMLRRGESFEAIKAYMAECSSPEYKVRMRNFTYYTILGYFEALDVFYDGGGWVPKEEDHFDPKERPWYKAAVEAGGKIALTPPFIAIEDYLDMNNSSRTVVTTYSRLLTDERGQPLAVVSMNVPLTFIEDFITDKHITENGFGWMMDENMVFIIHPDESFINIPMYEIPRFEGIVDVLRQNSAVSMHHYKSYKGEKAILFNRRLHNRWYVGLTIPEADFYQDMYTMILVISVLTFLAAVILSVIFISLDKAKRKADTENKQKSDFLATVSHEIRTPMNTIMGITEMQLREERLPNSLKEAFERIYFSGDLLLSIINDLLDLSKIEAGKLEIKPAKYDVASLIDEVIQLNKLRFASSPLEFNLQVGENVPETLVGDELRIKQVLNNLISNAFKYTDNGEIVFSVGAEIGESGDVMLMFAVRDTGHGMTAEQISRLFDRFTRFNMDTNRKIEGAGLGMSITRSLVNMMNGSINVESEVGKGSVFTVKLPQKLNGTADGSHTVMSKKLVENLNHRRVTSAAQVKRTQIIRKYMPYGNVLLVDDTEANLYVAKLIMTPYGMKIDTAPNGFEAIEKIKSGNIYDIIFMDHMMPVMDGIEAVKIIRSMGYSHPIIALTANAVVGQEDIFLTNGFDDFISKPIDMRILDMSLNEYIFDKQTPEVKEATQAKKEEFEAQFGAGRQQANDREALYDIAGLNTARGLAFFDDDIETYLSALRSYANNVPETLDKLRVVTEETLPEYAISVHGLKSISGWISAGDIRMRAENLETLAKAGDFAGVTTLNGVLLNETENFINDLREQLDEIDSGRGSHLPR
ncbi:MAG: response regulator [Treponema sp.]|jgi:signal transduction histidine kinase/CheY-like chemotaxis protein|nr:response regulator [Treponema sp.]